MKVSSLVLSSFAVLTAAQGTGTATAGGAGTTGMPLNMSPPAAKSSPAAGAVPGPDGAPKPVGSAGGPAVAGSANQLQAPGTAGGKPVGATTPKAPVDPNQPYAGASVPVVGQAPGKCSVRCALAGLQNTKCNALTSRVYGVSRAPDGSAPVGAVDRSVYEAVMELAGGSSQLPENAASLLAFPAGFAQCVCTGRNGRQLRNGGARCQATSTCPNPLPVSPQVLVSQFLNQLCGGVAGWVPVGKSVPRPKASPQPAGYPGGPPVVAMPRPDQLAQPTPAAAAPGAAGGASVGGTAAPASAPKAGAPGGPAIGEPIKAPGAAGGPGVASTPATGMPAPAVPVVGTNGGNSAVASSASASVPAPKALNPPNVPVAPSSGAAMMPSMMKGTNGTAKAVAGATGPIFP